MDGIVNLNRARKAKARAEEGRTAALNREKFGRTKAQKARDLALESDAARRLDQAKRE